MYIYNIFSIKFTKTLLLCCFVILITCTNRARGMTAFILHPCHLFPPTILASSSCTPPFPSASPRRADLLVFFPFRPPALVCSLCTTHGNSCCSSRCFSFFSCCVPPPSSPRFSASVFVPPATLDISLPRDAFLLLLPSFLACPSFVSFFFPLGAGPVASLFSLSERDAKNDGRCAREEHRVRKSEREKNYEQRKTALD